MADETVPERPVVSEPVRSEPVVTEAPPRPDGGPQGVYVPRWLAGVLILLVAGGIGFGIGRATDDDDHYHERRFDDVPRAVFPDRQRGPGLTDPRGRSGLPMPNRPNVPEVPNRPNLPSQPGGNAFLGLQVTNAAAGDGADVTAVMSGSPAATAGLQIGDRITSIDGKAIASSAELIAAFSGRSPGDTVVVGYVRGGVAATVRVPLGARADAAPTSPTTSRPALQLIS